MKQEEINRKAANRFSGIEQRLEKITGHLAKVDALSGRVRALETREAMVSVWGYAKEKDYLANRLCTSRDNGRTATVETRGEYAKRVAVEGHLKCLEDLGVISKDGSKIDELKKLEDLVEAYKAVHRGALFFERREQL